MTDLRSELDRALATVIDPEIRRPIADLGMIDSVEFADGRATIGIKLTIVGCPAADRIERDVREAAGSVPGVEEVEVNVAVMSVAERTALTERLQGARRREVQFGPETPTRIFAITSGKGGVGKSTITANLGVALAAKGLKVGIVDADVFGFSIPGLLGVSEEKPTRVGELMLPPIGFGVKVISIGMFLPGPATAVSWRGPMLHRTIKQFLSEVYFDELDILLLDLPPGTGDVAISVGQLLPHAQVVVVTTPQTAAADVAERSGLVARKTGQRVIGVVENMAGLPQADGTVLELFGTGGGADAAARLDVPLLASIPLSLALREGGDTGEPVVLSHPEDPAAAAILALAQRLLQPAR
ncbi:P-loop NTPase [Leifsonia bigeumensis]|uniref:Iron-sulfur cluster carrier protein n=1 Tax=Leifsonella bigeumensis TaxID=433643 RepID=A0ABP7G131_9MICO